MNRRKIILITGGQKSGKSVFAEKIALQSSDRPVYIATAKIFDEEFRKRVEVHKQRRKNQWINIEEPIQLSRHHFIGKTILVDCVTLWSTNIFFESGNDIPVAAERFKTEFDRFTDQDCIFIFVSTETGLGGTSENQMQRQFNDLQGEINQYIANKADEVYLIISGIDIRIK